jgi:cell division protein FtsQ
MFNINKYAVKKILVAMVWIFLCSGTVVLLIAAITKRNNEHCTKVDIKISGVQNNFFIDKKDVISILENTNGGKLENKPLHKIDLALMETVLQKSRWIKKAELFFDNNNVLEVKITEREPIARIFTTSGLSFYIDSSLTRLPLSDKFSPRLPVFTDFPTDVIVLKKEDSTLVEDIKTMSEFIAANPFWMAQIDQVDISPNREFDLIPKLGNNVIHFGKAERCEEKFNKLLAFYKQVLSKIGWNHYSSISVQYNNQVVGVKRGVDEIKMDSLRAVQIMKELIANAQKNSNDSTNVQLVQPADDNSNINASSEKEIVPDDNNNAKNTDGKVSVSVTPIHVPEKPVFENRPLIPKKTLTTHPSSLERPGPTPLKKSIIKPVIIKPPQKAKEKPKAVMPPKTDY